jgi:hypothetical protein
MKKSPKLLPPRFSREQMQRLYDENNFRALLAASEEIVFHDEEVVPGTSNTHPDTIRIRNKKWKLNGVTVATIIFYTHQDGSVTHSIRMLRVNGIKYHAVQKYPF